MWSKINSEIEQIPPGEYYSEDRFFAAFKYKPYENDKKYEHLRISTLYPYIHTQQLRSYYVICSSSTYIIHLLIHIQMQ